MSVDPHSSLVELFRYWNKLVQRQYRAATWGTCEYMTDTEMRKLHTLCTKCWYYCINCSPILEILLNRTVSSFRIGFIAQGWTSEWSQFFIILPWSRFSWCTKNFTSNIKMPSRGSRACCWYIVVLLLAAVFLRLCKLMCTHVRSMVSSTFKSCP